MTGTATRVDGGERDRAVFDGGSGGFDPPQEVADPPESSAEPLWGVDSNPPKNSPIPFSC